MARRKSATALFEVIQAGKFGSKPSAVASLRTPWWFKKRNPSADVPPPAASDPDDPTSNVTAAHLSRPRQTAPATSQPPLVVMFAEPPPITIPPLPRIADGGATALTPWLPPEPAPAPTLPAVVTPPPTPMHAVTPAADLTPAVVTSHEPDEPSLPRVFRSRNGMQVAFDGDRQEMTLKMRYTAAIVSGCTVLAVVGLAYVIGRHMAGGPQPAAAASDKLVAAAAQAKKGPVQPNVMDVSQRQGRATLTRGGEPAVSRVQTGRANAATVYADADLIPDGGARRLNNLNYLNIQSFPPERKQLAEELRKQLTARDIPCTVEHATQVEGAPKLPIPAGFYAVVGTRGFRPLFGETPEYKAYRNAVAAATNKLPNKSQLIYDKSDPQMFKWQE